MEGTQRQTGGALPVLFIASLQVAQETFKALQKVQGLRRTISIPT